MNSFRSSSFVIKSKICFGEGGGGVHVQIIVNELKI